MAALGWEGCVRLPRGEEFLPAWQPGELDLHFIYTGCGENMFYRLPDGTAILNDVGEFYRPEALGEVPLLPSPARLGGDWVARYLHRVYPEKAIDYAVFSHWHSDHIGHSQYGQKETPKASHRFRITSDGRKVNGFLCVAEDFKIERCLVHDHAFSNRGRSADSSLGLLKGYVDAEKKRGLKLEPFKVGALDQIRMQRDAAKYRDSFSIRNLCADGVLWDGRDGTVDFIGEHLSAAKSKWVSQNMLSLGFVMRYGKFSYLATGDFQDDLVRRADGRKMRMDGALGKLAGKVSVAKMSHHGCSNAMTQDYLNAIQAETHVGCMWCPAQSAADTMERIVKAGTANGLSPLILPQLLCKQHRQWASKRGWDFGYASGVHIVVRVAPGGNDGYRVYLLDASDESMRIVASFDK